MCSIGGVSKTWRILPAILLIRTSFLVNPGQYECVFANLPRLGLAAWTDHVPAHGESRDHTFAPGRLQRAGSAFTAGLGGIVNQHSALLLTDG